MRSLLLVVTSLMVVTACGEGAPRADSGGDDACSLAGSSCPAGTTPTTEEHDGSDTGADGVACVTAADCELVEACSTDCACAIVAKGSPEQQCGQPASACFQDPCASLRATCVGNRCALEAL